MSLQDRLRPWHGLMLAVFLVGAGVSLVRDGMITGDTVLFATLTGLFGLVLFQFTVGNVWAYAVEYRNAGGRWSDLPFLTPFVFGLLWGLVAFVTTDSVGAAAWAAFWGFAVVAALTAVAVWLAVGYRESSEAAG